MFGKSENSLKISVSVNSVPNGGGNYRAEPDMEDDGKCVCPVCIYKSEETFYFLFR